MSKLKVALDLVPEKVEGLIKDYREQLEAAWLKKEDTDDLTVSFSVKFSIEQGKNTCNVTMSFTPDMYPWVTHTWNPIKGRCQFECQYCYVTSSTPGSGRLKMYKKPCYLEEKELTTNLGKGRTIFVGSMGDMWGPWIKMDWIGEVMNRIYDYPKNTYVFQSKNPARFSDWFITPRTDFILGTTIETDEYPKGFQTKAPPILERFKAMRDPQLIPFRKFVTIEPIMDFDLTSLVAIIKLIGPEFVTIGADSKGHNLVEPSWEKVQLLISNITKFTEIRQKTNLERLKK